MSRLGRRLWFAALAAFLSSASGAARASAPIAQPHVALPPVASEVSERARAEVLTNRLAVALVEQGQLRVSEVDEPQPTGATASEVRRWGLATGADATVAARLEQEELWIELRSSHSGGLLGGWTVPPDVDAAGLGVVVASVREALGAPPVGAPADAVSPQSTGEDEAPLLGSRRSEGPISIHSDQLDVVSRGGKRHLVFKDNVRVEQGDMELRTAKLDAFYNEGESQPERLVAAGGVHVLQGERVARCDSATYLRSEQLIVCSGRARLVQGCDVVRGTRIEFDLEREHFKVMGAASVVLGRAEDECGPGDPS